MRWKSDLRPHIPHQIPADSCVIVFRISDEVSESRLGLWSLFFRTEPLITMKTTPLVRFAICMALFTSSAHAAGPVGKRFGGFAPKQTFSFKVENRQSFESKGSVTVQTFRIPATIPQFKVGQTVKFTIGTKGQLQGPGFSLPLELDNRAYNQYLTTPRPKNPTPDTALLTKGSAGKVRQIALYFYDEKVKGPNHSVTYLLK